MTAPSDERRIKLTLHYDGSAFFGWQTQPGVRTTQSELEAALSRLTDRPTSVIAAGRTDRGVHATGQVASALVPARWTAVQLRRALNAVLPEDLWVVAAEEVPAAFHARYDAVARGYTYRVGTSALARSPFLRRWCWPLAEPLDRDVLERAAELFPGRHSFRAFAKSGQPERGERCTVFRSRWTPWGEVGLAYRIAANRFLHHMVRYLVGTMAGVARGARPFSDLEGLLANEPGLETSPPAPPQGLFLTRVYYSAEELEREEPSDEDLP
ncbi:MAG: tRNA pseudouridine(38-40) synthase TruA [Gemmatimonadetes bacterium]|nr:tRNA pseudouridine(38-40) synthase TruA [Gemmatimonadota bacterium]